MNWDEIDSLYGEFDNNENVLIDIKSILNRKKIEQKGIVIGGCNMSNVAYVVIQAGGKGKRLEKMTINKPKALVSYKGKPFIFYTLEKFPDSKIIVIGDYKYEVLDKYLKTFASEYDIVTVKADGSGTNGGINQAMKHIPQDRAFVLVWCDLIIGKNEKINFSGDNIVKLSNTFLCRWQYHEGEFKEEPSSDYGVAGMFVFRSKEELKGLPKKGEFVKWLSESNLRFVPEYLVDTIEIGTTSVYANKEEKLVCRPFNSIKVDNGFFIKKPINDFGREIARKEINWYKEVSKYKFDFIPKIFKTEPLTMEYIEHEPIEELDLTLEKQREVFFDIVSNIKSIHEKKIVETVEDDVYETYFNKTLDRLNKVRELVPFNEKETIDINNKRYKNPFSHINRIKSLIGEFMPSHFTLIHGDITMSNMIFEEKTNKVFFIDPRGYFGNSLLYGDPDYDWAKLYYSVIGNYDQFNKKKFELVISNNDVQFLIKPNNWMIDRKTFFKVTDTDPRKIEFLHGLIWLSLTTYVWDDYDSICGAFYKGCIEMEGYL